MKKKVSLRELKDFIEWDIVNWGRSLEFWESQSKRRWENARALEVGARHGGGSLWLAQKGVQVLCTDLNGPTSEARKKHQRAKVARLIKYQKMDVLNIPYQNYFDFVILKSVLGGIRGEGNVQKRALSQIYKSLKKGGELLLAENLAGSPVHQFLRKRFVPWGKRWRYLFFEEIIELLEIFSEVKYITAGFLGALGRNNFQRTVLGYLDQLLIEKLVPQKWRYIFIAWAKK